MFGINRRINIQEIKIQGKLVNTLFSLQSTSEDLDLSSFRRFHENIHEVLIYHRRGTKSDGNELFCKAKNKLEVSVDLQALFLDL